MGWQNKKDNNKKIPYCGAFVFGQEFVDPAFRHSSILIVAYYSEIGQQGTRFEDSHEREREFVRF